MESHLMKQWGLSKPKETCNLAVKNDRFVVNLTEEMDLDRAEWKTRINVAKHQIFGIKAVLLVLVIVSGGDVVTIILVVLSERLNYFPNVPIARVTNEGFSHNAKTNLAYSTNNLPSRRTKSTCFLSHTCSWMCTHLLTREAQNSKFQLKSKKLCF